MKKLFAILVTAIVLFSCKSSKEEGKFTLTGELKNAPDQHIYLEELFFSQKDPEVVDTGEIKNGKFSVSATAPQQGLYRIRLEKGNSGFIFINDENKIKFTADANDLGIQGPTFSTPANASLKQFVASLDAQRTLLSAQAAKLEQARANNATDSIFAVESKRMEELNNNYKSYILKYIDTASHPIVALFALGYTRNIEPELLQKPVAGLGTRFPNHPAVATIVEQYNQVIAQMKQQESMNAGKPQVGSMAPDINMNDVNGKPFSLSQLRGKYVLVDFWASWCGPCREENPNVVAAYNKFKDRNFTILGVSLDDKKENWVKAIAADQLAWQHISDLKKWNSAAIPLYGFDGIPYNVLIDPQGKIIANDLRGPALHETLSGVLK